jgi:hypothetical protein
MFEQPVGKVEKDRSKIIIGISAVAVLLVVALIAVVSSLTGGQKALEMSLIGSAEFDSYAPNIQFDVLGKVKGERFNNSKYVRIEGVLRNEGDRVLTGVQIKILAVRYTGGDTTQYEIIKEKVVNPIPMMHDSLDPKRSVRVELYLEPLDDREPIDDILVLVNGLKVGVS